MLTFLWKKVIPGVIAAAGMLRLVNWGFALMNVPFDGAVIGGVLLIAFAILGFGSFVNWWYFPSIKESE